MTRCNISVPKHPPTETQVSAAVASGLMRAIGHVGKGALADRMETHVKTLDRALIGDSVPRVHTLFAALLADPTVLDELAALYGVVIRPAASQAANDMMTVASLAHAGGAFAEALADGRRDHNETIQIANLVRPLLKSLAAIVEEADAIRGAA